jgi:hypothetical protein
MKVSPILLITFNRPDHTRRVLEAIMAAQPEDLYVFQDGAREGNEDDIRKCTEVRRVVGELTKDTAVTLHTNYSERNLGCGAGPMTGINWFFNQVEKGIVMEDDCLPHPDFFGYCEELLERFQNDKKVLFINSTLYDDRWKCDASYDFSRYMVTGAWAGWRRTWQGFDLNLKDLDAKTFRKHVLQLTDNRAEANWWFSIVKEIQQDERKKSYWDFQMQIHLFRNSAITIHPKVNLVSNIGFDGAGTHTLSNNDNRGDREVFPILPLVHPTQQVVDKQRDAYCWAKVRSKGCLKDEISYVYQSLLWSNGLGHKLLMTYKKLRGKGVNTRKV